MDKGCKHYNDIAMYKYYLAPLQGFLLRVLDHTNLFLVDQDEAFQRDPDQQCKN
jgi:hypothetical protein